MTSGPVQNPIIAFLIKMHKLDKLKLKPRDVILIYTIIANPGINGKDLAGKLAIPERSHIQFALYKLEKLGYIEDRRKEIRKANPAIFHATEKGHALWNELKP